MIAPLPFALLGLVSSFWTVAFPFPERLMAQEGGAGGVGAAAQDPTETEPTAKRAAQEAETQDWSDEKLESEMAGFKENTTLAELQTVASLLRNQEAAFLAICNRVHGNHAEYLLRIEKLLDELANERWELRERAEKTLGELGGMARELVQTRANTAPTPEERIRTRRALLAIEAAGTEKAETEARYLRGLALTALYMKPGEKLNRALVSALRHTDPVIVQRCIRALGRHGSDPEAAHLIELLETSEGTFGLAIRSSLAAMQGKKGRDFVVERIADGKPGETEAMLLVRILRERTDWDEVKSVIAKSANATLVAGAGLTVPQASGVGCTVRIGLADQTKVEGAFLGYSSDCLQIGSPVVLKGEERHEIPMPALMFPLNRCDGIDFVGVQVEKPATKTRMFLVQGTLLTGDLRRIDGDRAAMTTATFGAIDIPRAEVQGLALDPSLDRLLGSSAKEDKIRFAGDRLVAGQIKGLDDKTLTYADAEGKAATAARDEVAGLLFQRPQQSPPDERLYTRVSLTNGDKILGHIAAMSPAALGVVAPGIGAAVIPLDQVVQMEFGLGGGAMWGFTLVADYSDSRIVEFDDQGREVFKIEDKFGIFDVECLDNGNLLVTEFSLNRVSEITRKNETVWEFDQLKNPYDADRLPNGNTLIADTFGKRVIEVDQAGKIVWSYEKDIQPYDVERLANGNTLIADCFGDRAVEVDADGKIVWELKNILNLHDVDRLPNGNTLLTIRMQNLVREVDPSGKTVFEITGLSSPSDADRLPNGNTIVAENGRVQEFDRHGNLVWTLPITWAVEVNRY